MSRLEELIQELCPNGVEYKTIQEVCVNICSGGTPKTSISEYYGGDIPWVRTQEVDWNYIYDTDVKITEEGLANSSAKWIPANCIIVAMYGATAAKVTINKIPVTTNQACCNLEINENIVLIRYVYHFLCNEYENLKRMGQGSQSNINAQMIKNYRLPVPPTEVQREIVRILDSFTLLTAELTAELTARKKQYEYYADKLLASNIPGSDWMQVGDTITSLKTGLNPRQNFKLNVGGSKPYITGKDVFNNAINVSDRTDMITEDVISLINKRACLETHDVLFASTGTGTVGRMAVIENYQNNWAVSETMYCLKPKKDIINPYYLMYVLYAESSRAQFEPKISKGSVPHLKVRDLLNVKIPVPNIEEQQRIVDILDRFDSLCNDISIGLPAEIEARQKQYEFYRDKLLSFKQL